MEMSGHVPVPLSQVKNPVPTEKEIGSVPEPVWTFHKREKPNHGPSKTQPGHYIVCTTWRILEAKQTCSTKQ
jgi:hypothetical protein